MAEKGKFEAAEETVRTAYSRFGLAFGMVVGLLALLIGVASFIIVVRAEKTEVAAQILASDELTRYPPVPGLTGRFTYAGQEVTHLWKVKVKFVNSGDKTIVGVGNRANIVGEGLNFAFPNNTRILEVEEEAGDFESKIVPMEPKNNFQIRFSQWRSGEYRIASFYVASDEPLDVYPLPTVPARDIIDGEVVVEDLTERGPYEQISLLDHLPRVISIPGKIIGGIFAGAIAAGLVVFMVWSWKNSVMLFKWKRRYLSDFFDYLDKLDKVEPKLDDYHKQMFRKKPYELPSPLWVKFEGSRAPESGMVFDNIGEAILYTIVPLILAFGPISLILMLIPA